MLHVSGRISCVKMRAETETGMLPARYGEMVDVETFGRELTTTTTIELHNRHHAPRTGTSSMKILIG